MPKCAWSGLNAWELKWSLDSPRGQEILLRTPMARFGSVDEVAGAAVFFAAAESGFVNGQILAVDGGYLVSGVNQ